MRSLRRLSRVVLPLATAAVVALVAPATAGAAPAPGGAGPLDTVDLPPAAASALVRPAVGGKPAWTRPAPGRPGRLRP